MNTLELAKLKQHLLREIEEPYENLQEIDWKTPTKDDAYPITKSTVKKTLNSRDELYSREYKYVFTNSKDIEMYVMCNVVFGEPESSNDIDRDTSLYISFAPTNKAMKSKDLKSKMPKPPKENPFYDPSEAKWEIITGAGDLRKLLATVAEAVNTTLNIERSKYDESINQLIFAPSDNRRMNLYKDFIEKAFPNWKFKSEVGSFIVYTKSGLQEIGDANSKLAYTWNQTKDLGNFKSFEFKTTSELNYVLNVRLQIQDLSSYDWDSAIVEFGIAKGEDQKPDYSVNTNAGELYRVMATVVKILKEKIIKKNPTITYIRFEAEKQGHKSSKRTNLYTLYLQSHIKNAKVDKIKDTEEGEVIVMHLSPPAEKEDN